MATTLLFSAWLNVAHGYEHDDHDEHEQHSEECGICCFLSGLSDSLVDDSNANPDRHLAEENYLFVIKNNLSAVIRFKKTRAPPHIQNLI